jgi:basic membrane lipoprotein Med (substrate-binding protein (PBP1-ABC) superfamily)
LRAGGESPVAAVAAGFSPDRLQFQALAVAGLLGGIAGAHLSLSLTLTLTWEEGMTAGRGFIAIALVRVVVTSCWSDKAKEAAAANALIDQGADSSVKIGCGRGLFEKAALHLA